MPYLSPGVLPATLKLPFGHLDPMDQSPPIPPHPTFEPERLALSDSQAGSGEDSSRRPFAAQTGSVDDSGSLVAQTGSCDDSGSLVAQMGSGDDSGSLEAQSGACNVSGAQTGSCVDSGSLEARNGLCNASGSCNVSGSSADPSHPSETNDQSKELTASNVEVNQADIKQVLHEDSVTSLTAGTY